MATFNLRTLGFVITLLSFPIFLLAQDCNTDAGTVSLIHNGVNDDGIICPGDYIELSANGDAILPDGSSPGVMFAIYSCPPSGPIEDDDCWTGYYWTGDYMLQYNDGSLQSIANGNDIYIVPITADAVNLPEHDENNDGCYALGDYFYFQFQSEVNAYFDYSFYEPGEPWLPDTIATPGGTFHFFQTPNDGAEIDTLTGAITNVTIGNTYYIEHRFQDADCTFGESVKAITAIKNDPPVAKCRQNIELILDSNNEAFLEANQIDDGSSDDNGSVSLSVSPAYFTCDDVGDITALLSVEDIYGGITTCETTITILDTVSPSLICPNDTVVTNILGLNFAEVNSTILADDNCTLAEFTISPQQSFYPIGTTPISVTAIDQSNNVTTCAFEVTVIDIEPPRVYCPSEPLIAAADVDDCGTKITWSPIQATDNDGVIGLEESHHSGTFFPVGVTEVEVEVFDPSGLSSNCSFEVIVEDRSPPTFSCRNILIELDEENQAMVEATDLVIESSDNCGIAGFQSSQTYFNENHIGTNLVRVTATDIHGNIDVCYSNVIIAPSNYSPNCDGEEIYLNTTPIAEGQYNAANRIIADGKIQANDEVIFEAGQEIILQAGFEVNESSSFRARIWGCISEEANNFVVNEDNKSTVYKNESEDVKLSVIPNPIGSYAEIKFNLPEYQKVQLKLYNALGQKVLNILDGYFEAGVQVAELKSSLFSPGVYFLKLSTSNGHDDILKLVKQ